MVGSLLALPAWSLSDSYTSKEEFLATRVKNFPGLEVELARLNAVMSHDLRHQVKNITAPTGVISAKDDALTPPAMSDELAELIPNAIRVTMAEGGHFCPAICKDEYNEKLLKLLQQLSL